MVEPRRPERGRSLSLDARCRPRAGAARSCQAHRALRKGPRRGAGGPARAADALRPLSPGRRRPGGPAGPARALQEPGRRRLLAAGEPGLRLSLGWHALGGGRSRPPGGPLRRLPRRHSLPFWRRRRALGEGRRHGRAGRAGSRSLAGARALAPALRRRCRRKAAAQHRWRGELGSGLRVEPRSRQALLRSRRPRAPLPRERQRPERHPVERRRRRVLGAAPAHPGDRAAPAAGRGRDPADHPLGRKRKRALPQPGCRHHLGEGEHSLDRGRPRPGRRPGSAGGGLRRTLPRPPGDLRQPRRRRDLEKQRRAPARQENPGALGRPMDAERLCAG